MKTIKTIAIAAVMTVIGATTTFANNTPRKPNNNNHVAKVEKNHMVTKSEYQNAKRCGCKTCNRQGCVST